MSYFKFERLEVWKRSIAWADEVFSIADALPQKYQFSLGEQLRRAALSVPTNIAEGSGRGVGKEGQYFFGVAKGSVYEVVSLLVMCGKRGFVSHEVYRAQYATANEIASMLTAMRKRGESKDA